MPSSLTRSSPKATFVEIRYLRTSDGKIPFQDWLTGIRDVRTRVAVVRPIDRLRDGNAGSHRYLRDGVSEMKIDTGPGYRVYYCREGSSVILLLSGGSKQTQAEDIDTAVSLWRARQSQV